MLAMDEKEYRSLDEQALDARRLEIAQAIDAFNGMDENITLDMLKDEVRKVHAEIERRNLAMSARSAKLNAISQGAGKVIDSAKSVIEVEKTSDLFSSDEYNRAFAARVLEKRAMPTDIVNDPQYQMRQAEFTTVVGTSVAADVVPTNLQNRIVIETQNHGELYAGVNKTSYPAGIEIPTMSMRPAATWISETKASDAQKIEPDGKISFNHYGLEVKLAQSLLAKQVTLEAFQSKFVELAADARAKALDMAIVNGTGTGQPTGITKDSRVKLACEFEQADLSKWAAWHSKFKKLIKKSYMGGSLIMSQATFDEFIEGMVDAQGQPVARVNYGISDGSVSMRFMGINVITLDDVIADYASAKNGDVFAIYTKLSDYTINSSLPLRTTSWTDEDANVDKYKLLEWLDGKIVDPYGTVLLKKKATA